ISVDNSNREEMSYFISLLLIFGTIALTNADDDVRTLSNPVIQTSHGKIRGATRSKSIRPGIKPNDTLTFTEYLGVPYAKAPLGSLRWKLPETPSPWNETKDAVGYSDNCYQAPLDTKFGNISEDCLYLNIWSTLDYTQDSAVIENQNLSVMFFVHGGGFKTGFARFFGGYLADAENVIVVAANYRLGLFGFMTTEDATIPGNYGMHDLIKALEWVKANIRMFGGDPDSVTIFGESTGAGAVSHLMLSPLTKGLFKRGIAESGEATSPFAFGVNYQRLVTMELSNRVGCGEIVNEAMRTCMELVQAETLQTTLSAIQQEMQPRNDSKADFYPTIDGFFMKDTPLNVLKSGDFEPRDYITGFNSHESYFLWFIQFSAGFTTSLKAGLTEAQMDTMLKGNVKYLDNNDITTGNNFFKTVKQFYGDFESPPEMLSQKRSVGFYNFLTDFLYGAQSQRFADYFSRKSRVYSYYLSAKVSPDMRILPGDPSGPPDYVLSSHGDDLAFVFGGAKYISSLNATLEEQNLSTKMMRAWANFAKTGNPNPTNTSSAPFAAQDDWPAYNETHRWYYSLTTPSVNNKALNGVIPGRMALWKDFIWEVIDRPQAECQAPSTPSSPFTSSASSLTTPTVSSASTSNCESACTAQLRKGAGVSIQPSQVGAVIWSLTGLSGVLLITCIILLTRVCSKKTSQIRNIDYEEELRERR
ncbi:unnamed protein product, partial [Owenia fusiformis]